MAAGRGGEVTEYDLERSMVETPEGCLGKVPMSPVSQRVSRGGLARGAGAVHVQVSPCALSAFLAAPGMTS